MGDAVAVKDVSRYFGSRPALIDVSLKIRKGCIFCIAGPNGSGKTTLLSIIAGVLAPSKGMVEIDRNLRLGYAYQHPKLSEELTAGENLAFFSQLTDARDAKWGKNLVKVLKLDEILDDNADGLSSGTRKRLEIAVSLLHNPEIILLDEPTAGLDVESTREVLGLVKLFKKERKTVVVATHQLENFCGICERLAVLSRGRLVLERDVRKVCGKRLMQLYESALAEASEKPHIL
ncbi:ABC transporter ATP-binding protein [Candidatus Micrarchaeota archaeon]|nr:ABC transporter ATP-binding protein [Candidatus Micrarchaeota archaeon]